MSVSENGVRTLSMVSDSRVSWDLKNNTRIEYNFSQKLFHLHESNDVFGYCGDSGFCLSNLLQIVFYLNNSIQFSASQDFDTKRNILYDLIDKNLKHYPAIAITESFTIYWNSFLDKAFYSHKFVYNKITEELSDHSIKLPIKMSYVFYDGSGGKYYYKALENLDYKNNNYSRVYFKALNDIIESQIDQKTGGPPQMISVSSNKGLLSTSFLFEKVYYLFGIEDMYISNTEKVEYRDTDFNYRTSDGKIRNNYSKSYIRKLDIQSWKTSTLKNKPAANRH